MTANETSLSESMPVLTAIEELSVEWLSEVVGGQVGRFEIQEIVGEGYASRMYRLFLEAAGAEAVPSSLILKLATVQETQKELMDPEVFCREVTFYEGLGKKLGETDMLPTVYFAKADKSQMQLTLLFEDLGEIPHKPWREDLVNSLAAAAALAKIHATYWQSEELLHPNYAPVEGELEIDDLVQLLQDNLDAEAAADYSYPYLRDCAQHVKKLAHWLIGETDQFHGPMSLIHGDFHTRNIHFTDDRVVVFDWQVTERGRPVRDLIYWMLLCVDVSDIEAFKPVLIERYLQALEENGVTYKRSEFLRDFNESLLQMVSRIFCYQTLITLSEQDQHELENFLDRTEAMAKTHFVRGQLRLARVLAPPIIWFLRLIGKR